MKVPTISTVAVIDMIISNNDNEELMRLFWLKSMEMINDTSVNAVTKIEKQQDANILFKNWGFKDMIILEKEKNSQNLQLMDYML